MIHTLAKSSKWEQRQQERQHNFKRRQNIALFTRRFRRRLCRDTPFVVLLFIVLFGIYSILSANHHLQEPRDDKVLGLQKRKIEDIDPDPHRAAWIKLDQKLAEAQNITTNKKIKAAKTDDNKAARAKRSRRDKAAKTDDNKAANAVVYPKIELVYPEIDLVYLWVNGSDPVWNSKKQRFYDEYIKSFQNYKNLDHYCTGNHCLNTTNTKNRFQDMEELRYSLRSVAKHAPWIQNIYIVVADEGQIPSWLDTSHPQINVVFHSTIFERSENLPSFNSIAIEIQIDNIPGLADYFLYANDDMFFGSHVEPSDYFVSTSSGLQYMYEESYSARKQCAEGCGYEDLQDSICDSKCNVADCNWDFGDCGGEGRLRQNRDALRAQLLAPEQNWTDDGWLEMLKWVDGVYNREFLVRRQPRNVMAHMPHLINKRMMGDMKQRFRFEFDLAATHRFRHGKGMPIAHSYFHYLEGAEVYAPTVAQAWSKAFDTLRENKVFLYGNLPSDPVEAKRAEGITKRPEYATVENCAKSAEGAGDITWFKEACDQAMRKLVINLRLPLPTQKPSSEDLPYSDDEGEKLPRGTRSNINFLMVQSKNAYQLTVSKAMKKKFVTINDDIEDHDGYIPKRMKILYNCLFPEASAYEKDKHSDFLKTNSINCDSLGDPMYPGPDVEIAWRRL